MSEHLPYNAEAEEAVLGCLLVDGSKIKKVREILKNEDFYEDKNRFVFRAMEWLDNKEMEVDVLTVNDALIKAGFIEAVGGAAHLTELTSSIATSVQILTYAQMVADDSAKRQITAVAKSIAETSSGGSTLDETLAKMQEKISEVNHIGGKKNKYQVTSMGEYVEASKERYKLWGKMQGLPTGFPSIDRLTLGLVGGELIIVAGPTSRGKTLLSMNIGNNIAKLGGRVLFVTLEMTHEELTSRYMFANGGWETHDFAMVSANTIFQQNDELDWQDIDGLIKNAKEQLDVDIVIIDHLHYFTRELQNVAEDLGRITKEFKKNAIRYNIPIILISHIRKMQKDEELSGDSLRGSSLIAQDADIVLMVNRDPETNAMGIMIDKNRNRGKLSDRTKDWGGRSEREVNTAYLDFNNTKLYDPSSVYEKVNSLFPGSESVTNNK